MTSSLPHFLILSMPRSRSAWLANLLTTPATWCGHDVCHSPLGFFPETKGFQFAGAVGSDIAWAHESMRLRYPNARMGVLIRDHEAVVESLRRAGIVLGSRRAEQVERLEDMLFQVAEAHRYPTFSFDALDRGPQESERIWSWAIGEAMPFNLARWELLSRLNVQVERDLLRARIDAW